MPEVSEPNGGISSRFGSNTFSLKVMREKLPRDVFKSLERTIASGEKLQPKIADAVAHAMKEWALDRGATHYCHWFQPLTGSTAEKHDAFLTIEKDGVVIERLSGSRLIQGEPDASSFPSGGARTTFEARGYTAWDPKTPAFLMESGSGATLCIPSVFLSYNGDALDEKTPLLRSLEAINRSAVRMLKLLGIEGIRSVTTTVGSEQEYFLVDHAHYEQRPDLKLAGRTLLGAVPPKGQQLEDHYFGAIRERALDFMVEVERELLKLGVPAKTRHNEVAPQQYEIAPIHEQTNIAADHNLLVMETMRKVAARKGLALLLHEKPFAGINGSGKHNNWSLRASDGSNLLDPGDTPASNLRFLVFLVATLKAVFERAPILRASIASPGNDHRLGANEAPPAIMSVFVGAQLTRILEGIERGEESEPSEPRVLSLGLSSLPAVSRDNTDRNRTSPFAFTGNKFEFRAVPSSMSISVPNTVLNTVVAEALDKIADEIEARMDSGKNLAEAIGEVLRDEIRKSRPVRFEGDGYSPEWEAEAAKRGLPNVRTTPEALEAWLDADTRAMFKQYKVFRESEMEARYHVRLEQYVKALGIEGQTQLNMIRTLVLPGCLHYQREVAQSVATLMDVSRTGAVLPEGLYDPQVQHLRRIATSVSELIERAGDLEAVLDTAAHQESTNAQAGLCTSKLIPAMLRLREVADRLEGLVDRRFWPIPTYLDILFYL